MRTVLAAMPDFAKRCPEAIEYLKEQGIRCVVQEKPGAIHLDEYEDILNEAEAIISGTESFWGAEEMDRMKQLKLISRFGIGYDNVDIAAAAKRGIFCTNVPNGNSNAVAEYTIALMLSLIRQIPASADTFRKGDWVKLQGIELREKTVGFLGFGRIAKRTAELLSPFHVRILACDLKSQPKNASVTMVRMEELFRESDIISIHVSASRENQHLIGARELSWMKKTAFLINISRGGVVDEQALYEVLKNHQITGAASDVFSTEPPGKECRLRELDNFIGTCHLAGGSIEAGKKIGMTIAKAIIAVFCGEKPENTISP